MKKVFKRIIAFVLASTVMSSFIINTSALKVAPGNLTVLDFSDKSNYNVILNKTEDKNTSSDKTVNESKQFTTEFINDYFRKSEEEKYIKKTPVKSVYFITKEMTNTELIDFFKKYLESDKIINYVPDKIKLNGSLDEFWDLIKDIAENEEKIIDVGKGKLQTQNNNSGNNSNYTFMNKGDIFSKYTDECYTEIYGDNELSPSDPDYFIKLSTQIVEKTNINNQLLLKYDEWLEDNSELISSGSEYSDSDDDKWANFWYWLEKYINDETLTPETAEILFDTTEKYKFWIWLIDNNIIEYIDGYTTELPEVWNELKDTEILTNNYNLKDATEKIEYLEKLYKIKKICETSTQEETVNITYITEINAKSDTYRKVHTGKYLSNYEWYIYSDKGFLEHHITTSAPWLSFVPNQSDTTYTAVCYQSKEDTQYNYFDYCKDYYAYLTDSNELIYSSRIEGSKLVNSETTIIQEKLGEINIEVGKGTGGITINVNDFNAGFTTERVR